MPVLSMPSTMSWPGFIQRQRGIATNRLLLGLAVILVLHSSGKAIAAECDLHTLGWCGALPESLYGHSLTAIAGEMVAYGGRRQGDDGIQLAPGDRAWLYNPGSMEGRWMALTTDLPLKKTLNTSSNDTSSKDEYMCTAADDNQDILPGRWGHAASALGRMLFVFGGATRRGHQSTSAQVPVVGWRLLSDLIAIDMDTGRSQHLCGVLGGQATSGGVARPRARIGAALTVSPSGDRVYLSGGWGTVLQGSVNVTEAPGTPDEVYSELNRHAGLLVRLTDTWVCYRSSGVWRRLQVNGLQAVRNNNASRTPDGFVHRLHARSILAVNIFGLEFMVAHGLVGNVMSTGSDSLTDMDLPLSPTAVHLQEVLAAMALVPPHAEPTLHPSPATPAGVEATTPPWSWPSHTMPTRAVNTPNVPPPSNPDVAQSSFSLSKDQVTRLGATYPAPHDAMPTLSSATWAVLAVLDSYIEIINLSLQHGTPSALAVQPWDSAPFSSLRLSGPASAPGLVMERLGPGPVAEDGSTVVDCGMFHSVGKPYLIGLELPSLSRAFELATSSSDVDQYSTTALTLQWMYPVPPQPITMALLNLFSDSGSAMFIGGSGPQPLARWATVKPEVAENVLAPPANLLLLGALSASSITSNQSHANEPGVLCHVSSSDRMNDILLQAASGLTAPNRAVMLFVPEQGADVRDWPTSWRTAQELNTPPPATGGTGLDNDPAFLQFASNRHVLGAIRIDSCSAAFSVAFLALAPSVLDTEQPPNPLAVHMLHTSLSATAAGSSLVSCLSWPTHVELQDSRKLTHVAPQQDACLVVAAHAVNASFGGRVGVSQDRLEAAVLLLEVLGNRVHPAATLMSISLQPASNSDNDRCPEYASSTYAVMVFGGRATTVMPAMPQALEEQTEGIVSALSGSEWFEDEGSIHANSAPAAGSITPLLHTPVDLLSDAFILVWQSGVQGSNIDAGHAANSDYVGRWIAQPLVPGMDVTAPWPQPREGASMSAWALDGSSEPGGDNSDNIVVMFGGVVQPQDGGPLLPSNELWVLQLDSRGSLDADHTADHDHQFLNNSLVAEPPPPLNTDMERRQLQLNFTLPGNSALLGRPPSSALTSMGMFVNPQGRWQLKYQSLRNQTTPAVYDISPSDSAAVLEVFNSPLVSLPDAAAICASRPGGGYLATLLTALENQRLAELANTQDVWLGLSRTAVPPAGGNSMDAVSALPELAAISPVMDQLEQCQLNTSAGSNSTSAAASSSIDLSSIGSAPRSYAWTWQDGFNNRTVADGLRAGTSGAGWTNWGRLEPDNKDGKEGQCVTMLSQGAVAGQWVDRSCDTLQAFACRRPAIGISPVPGRRPRVLDYVGGASNSSAAFLDDTMYWAPGVLRTWEEANEVCKQAGGWLLEARNSDINDLAMRLCLSVRSAIRSTVSTTGGGCWFGLFSATGGGTEEYAWGQSGMRGKLSYAPQPPWANTYPQKTYTTQCGALGMPAPAASATESAGWMNADCSLRLAFLCERPVPPAPGAIVVQYRHGRVLHVHGAKSTTSSPGEPSYVHGFSSFDDADIACQRVAMRLAPAPSLDHLADLVAAAHTAMTLGIQTPASNGSSSGQLQLFWLGGDNGWGNSLGGVVQWLESQDAVLSSDTGAGLGNSQYGWPAMLGPTADMWENAATLKSVTNLDRSCVALSLTTGKLRLLPCNVALPYICSSKLLPDLVTTRVTATGPSSSTALNTGSTPSTSSSSGAAAAAAAVFAPATGVPTDRRATYAFFRTPLPFPDAARACSDFGGHVVPVKSRDEDVYLSAIMARQLTAWLNIRGFWIGLRFNPFLGDGGSYDWEDPQPASAIPYSNYDQSLDYEPTCRSVDCCLVTRVYFDAISMAEARAAIDTAADVGNGAGDVSASGGPLLTSKVDLKWASINCSLPRPFVCRRADSDGQVHNMTAYVSAHNVPLDWAAANNACQTGIRAASLLPTANINFLRNRSSLALSVAYESGAFVPSLGNSVIGSVTPRQPPANFSSLRPPPRPPSPVVGVNLTAAAWVWLGLNADRFGRWYSTDGSLLTLVDVSQQIGDVAAGIVASAAWPINDPMMRLCLAVDLNSTRAMLLPCDTDLAYLCYGGLQPAASLLTPWGQELLVIGHRLPYAAAETACQMLGAHLASFTADTPRTTGSRMVANSLGSAASFWIGLDDNNCCEDCKPDQGPIGCYQWTDGRDTSLSYNYFDPLIGLPLATPTASTANCTAASANSLNVWTNRNCSDLLPALCMRQRRPPILYQYMDWSREEDSDQCTAAHEYLFLNASASRTDAESACRAHDAHLVSLHSARDMQILANMTARAYTEYRRQALTLRVPAPYDSWWIGLSYMPTGLLTGSATISNASHPSATPPMRWTDQTPYDYPAALPAITVSSGSASLLSEVPLPAVTMPRDGWCYRTASLQSLPSAGDPSNSIIATTVDLIATQCINTHQAKLSKEEAVRVCVQDSGTLASPLSSDLGMVSQRLQTEFPSTRQGLPMAWINATAASRGGVLDAHCVALAAGGVPVAANCQTELPFVCQRRLKPESSLEVTSTQTGYTMARILGVSNFQFYLIYANAQRAASACYALGGSLLTLRNDDEADALARLVGGASEVLWSGLYWSAGSFYNVDGSEVAYLRWLAGEPSLVTTKQQQAGASQYCVALVRQVGKTPSWRMRAVSCIMELPFICRESAQAPSLTTLRGTQTVAFYPSLHMPATDAAAVCRANGMQLIRPTRADDVVWVRMTSTRMWKPSAESPTTLATNATNAVWTGLVMRVLLPAGLMATSVSLSWWPGEPITTNGNLSNVASAVVQRVSAMGYGVEQGLLPGTFVEHCMAISLQEMATSQARKADDTMDDLLVMLPCNTPLSFMCQTPDSSPPVPDLAFRVPAVVGSSFEVFKTSMGVTDADTVCRTRGGRLTSIHSVSEEAEIMDAVQRHIGDVGMEPRFWIGLALFNSLSPRWMDGSFYDYSNALRVNTLVTSNTSQPLCFAVSSRGWISHGCAIPLPFICRVPDADPRWQYARRVLRAAYYYYYFTWRPATESDADAACRAIDRHPVSFQSVTDLQELGVSMIQDVAAFDVTAIDSTQLSTVAAFWSGLSLKRFVVDASSNVTVLKYIWRDGTPFDMDSEIARYLQLPSPSNASVGSCIGIDVATGKAIFTSCLSTYFYICKGGTFPSMYLDFDGFRLSYYPEAASAVVAQSICSSSSSGSGGSSSDFSGLVMKGSLASLRTSDEERAAVLLTDMATNAGNVTTSVDVSAGLLLVPSSNKSASVWIGLQRSAPVPSTFRFTDGTGVTYTNWAPGQPHDMAIVPSNDSNNSALNSADALCVRLLVSGEPKSSAWYTAPCSQQELPFICKAVSPLPEPAASWTWGGWEYLVYMPSLGITDVDYLGGLSFDTAQATCEHVGGSLMSVESTPEHEAALANVASWSNNFSISAAIWVGVRAMVVLAGDDTSSTAKMSTDTATLKLEYVDGSERIWNGAGPPSAVLASALLQWQARWGTNTSTLNGTVSEGMSAGCVAWDVSPQSKGGPGTYIILPCKSRVSAFICKRPGSKPSLVTIINDTRYTGYMLPAKWLPADEADSACSRENQEDGIWPSELMLRQQPHNPSRLAVLASPSTVRSLATQLSPFLQFTNTSLVHIGLVLSKLSTGLTAASWRDGSSYLLNWAAGVAGFGELADSLQLERVCVAVNVTSSALVKVSCESQLPYACSGPPLPDLVYTSNRASYMVFSTDLTREQARAVCKTAGAGLSLFTPALTSAATVSEAQLVTKIFKQVMPARSQFWIGLRAVSTVWSWQDMPTPTAMASNQNGSSLLGGYRAWSAGEPGAGLASGLSCAAGEVVEVGSGMVLQWRPVDCARAALPFVCKVPLAVPPPQPSGVPLFDYNGYQYLVATPSATQPVSFDIASVTCGQLGGRLALLQDINLRMKLFQEALDLPATFKSVIFGNMDGCKATGGVNTYIPQRLVLNQANGVSILALWTNMILTSGRPRWADGTLFSEEQLALWDKSGENYEPTAPSPVAVSLLGANASSAPPPSMLGGGNAVDQCGTIAFGRCSNGQGLLAWQSRPCESDLGYICERLPPPTVIVSRGANDYLIYNHFFTQRQAHTVCAAASSALTSLQDEQEQSWMLEQVSSMLIELTFANASQSTDAPPSVSYAILLGLDNGRYLDEFRWIDGSPFVYSAWAPGQPRSVSHVGSTSNGVSFCVSLLSVTGMWQVVDCATQSLFVCKRPRAPPSYLSPDMSPTVSYPVVTLAQPPPVKSSTGSVNPILPPAVFIATEPNPPSPPKPPAMPWRQGARPPAKQPAPIPSGNHVNRPVEAVAPALQFDDFQQTWPRLNATPMWSSDPLSPVPEARQRHAATPLIRLPNMTAKYDSRKYMFVYGGTVNSNAQDPVGIMDDLWLLQIRPNISWTKMRCFGSPGPRLDASLHFHADMLILTGGITFDAGSNSWTHAQSTYMIDLLPLVLSLKSCMSTKLVLPTLRWILVDPLSEGIQNSSAPCPLQSPNTASPMVTGASAAPIANGGQVLHRLVYGSGTAVHARSYPRTKAVLQLPLDVDMPGLASVISVPTNIYPAAFEDWSTLHRRHVQDKINDMDSGNEPDINTWLSLAPRSMIHCNGSGLLVTSDEVHLQGLAFINCQEFAVHIVAPRNAVVTITNCWFEKNSGSALLVTSGRVVIQQSVFRDIHGTAILMDGSNATLMILEHSWLIDNDAANSRSAGLVAVHGASVSRVHACTFMRNHGARGPAVYLADGHGVTIFTESHFTGNSAAEGGGAVYAEGGSILFNNNTFQSNIAGNGSGGAVMCTQCIYLGIFNSHLEDNLAQGATTGVSIEGGAVFAGQTCITHILATKFEGNMAKSLGHGLAKGGAAAVSTSCTDMKAQIVFGDVVFLNNSADASSLFLRSPQRNEEAPRAFVSKLHITMGDTQSAPPIYVDRVGVKYTCDVDLAVVTATLAQLTASSPSIEGPINTTGIQEPLVALMNNFWYTSHSDTRYYNCPSWLSKPFSSSERQALFYMSVWESASNTDTSQLSPSVLQLSVNTDAPYLAFYSIDPLGRLYTALDNMMTDCCLDGCPYTRESSLLVLPLGMYDTDLLHDKSCYNINISVQSLFDGNALAYPSLNPVTCCLGPFTPDLASSGVHVDKVVFSDEALDMLHTANHILVVHANYCGYTVDNTCTQMCMLPSSGYTSYGNCAACWSSRALSTMVFCLLLVAPVISILVATCYIASSTHVASTGGYPTFFHINSKGQRTSLSGHPHYAEVSSSHLMTDVLQDFDLGPSYLESMHGAQEPVRMSSCSTLPSWSGNSGSQIPYTKPSAQILDSHVSSGNILISVAHIQKEKEANQSNSSGLVLGSDSQETYVATTGPVHGAQTSTDSSHMRGFFLYFVLLGLVGKLSAAKDWVAPLRWLFQVAGLLSGVDFLGGGFISVACILGLDSVSADGYVYTRLVGWLITGSLVAVTPFIVAGFSVILQSCGITRHHMHVRVMFWACAFSCLLVAWPFLALESISLAVPCMPVSLESRPTASQPAIFIPTALGWTGVALVCGAFPALCVCISYVTVMDATPDKCQWTQKVLYRHTRHELFDWVSRLSFLVPVALADHFDESKAAFEQLALCVLILAMSTFYGLVFCSSMEGFSSLSKITAAHLVGVTMLLVAQAMGGATAAGLEWATLGFYLACTFTLFSHVKALLLRHFKG